MHTLHLFDHFFLFLHIFVGTTSLQNTVGRIDQHFRKLEKVSGYFPAPHKLENVIYKKVEDQKPLG